MSKVDILAFAAHPDDVELAASGTIIKHIKQGKSVAIVDLTQGELGSRGSAEIRLQEATKSAKILGLSSRENLNIGDGFFEINQDTLLIIVKAIRKYKPEIVFCNAPSDRHPDHGRASELVSRACFLSGLIKIDTNQEAHRPKAVYKYIQDRYINPDFIVDITDEMDQKMESILAFSSQFYKAGDNSPKTPISSKDFLDFVNARAQEFGRNIGVKYAEGFVVERPIGVDDITKLL